MRKLKIEDLPVLRQTPNKTLIYYPTTKNLGVIPVDFLNEFDIPREDDEEMSYYTTINQVIKLPNNKEYVIGDSELGLINDDYLVLIAKDTDLLSGHWWIDIVFDNFSKRYQPLM